MKSAGSIVVKAIQRGPFLAAGSVTFAAQLNAAFKFLNLYEPPAGVNWIKNEAWIEGRVDVKAEYASECLSVPRDALTPAWRFNAGAFSCVANATMEISQTRQCLVIGKIGFVLEGRRKRGKNKRARLSGYHLVEKWAATALWSLLSHPRAVQGVGGGGAGGHWCGHPPGQGHLLVRLELQFAGRAGGASDVVWGGCASCGRWFNSAFNALMLSAQ